MSLENIPEISEKNREKCHCCSEDEPIDSSMRPLWSDLDSEEIFDFEDLEDDQENQEINFVI